MDALTLDMNIIRDATETGRVGHANALHLLQAAARGDVELLVPPQGVLADLHGRFDGELARRVASVLRQPGVARLPQVSRLSDVTFPADDLLLGYYVDGFDEAWAAVISSWRGPGKRPGDFDRWYVESHLLSKGRALVTEDVALRTMCTRLRDEHGFEVRSMSLAEILGKLF